MGATGGRATGAAKGKGGSMQRHDPQKHRRGHAQPHRQHQHRQHQHLQHHGRRGLRAGRVHARRPRRGGDDRSSSKYFDLRRAEQERSRTADAHEAKLNARLRNPSGSTSEASRDEMRADDEVTFFKKVDAAWKIFFPPQTANLRNMNARQAGKNRLRMILVADRSSISPEVMSEMKSSVVKALKDYVEIDSSNDVDLSVSTDDDLGTVYSVSVPVRCLKPNKRSYYSEEGIVDGDTGAGAPRNASGWDDWDSNPSQRFPWGT